MFAWILNTKPVTSGSAGATTTSASPRRAWTGSGGGAKAASVARSSVHAEMAQRRAEDHRRHVPLAERLFLERLGGAAHQLRPLLQLARLGPVQQARRGVGAPGDGAQRLLVRLVGVADVGDEGVGPQVEHALEAVPRARGPVEGGRVQGELGADLVEQRERVQRLPVHLVDEGDDRDVAQAAHLEQLQRLRLDALGGVQHHHRGVGGGERAVGVLAEVLVARGIEQVEGQPFAFEGHHAGRDADPPLPLDLHPVRARAPVLAARPHRPRRPDRAAGQQQVLGQRRLAGVGVGDDRERPPLGRLDGEGGRCRPGGVGGGRGGHGAAYRDWLA